MAIFKTVFCLFFIVQLHYLTWCCVISSIRSTGSYLRLERNLLHQAVIPSYKLNCTDVCGRIVDWRVYVYANRGFSRRRRAEKHSDDFELSRRKSRHSRSNSPATARPLLGLQVWRPLPPINGSTGAGCYSLVASQGITSIPSRPSLGVRFPLTPSVREGIPFQSGDVLGFFVDIPDIDSYDDIGLTVLRQPRDNLVWYADDRIPPAIRSSVYIVGNERGVREGDLDEFSNVAPAISISIEAHPCPTSRSTPSDITTSTELPSSPTTTLHSTYVTPSVTTSSISMDTLSKLTMQTPSPRPDAGPGSVTDPKNNIATAIGPQNSPLPTILMKEFTGDDMNGISTDPILPLGAGGSNNLGELLAGTIAATLAVLVFATLLVLVIIVIFKRRVRKETDTLSDGHSKRAFLNKAYERLGRPDEFVTSYASIEASAVAVVPQPRVRHGPPTETISAALRRGSESINVVTNGSHVYHDIGPSTQTNPTSNGEDTTNNHTYHYVVEGRVGIASNNNIYEDPNRPTFRGVKSSEVGSTDVFDSAGIHVPTLDERHAWEGHYNMQDIKVYNRLKFFDEERVYWAPASTASDLYSQLASKKYREIPRNQIRIQNRIGSGQFGEVYKALWSISGTTKELAIKTLRGELPEEEKVRFLQEAAIMGQFSHPNIVKLYGVVTVGDPMMICLELMANGDLRYHLCSLDLHTYNSKELKVQLLRFSKQIAAGMEYLASKSFVHRDLAARNIFLDQTLTCKIGDFGMARDLMNETYYTAHSKGAKIPIKWTAPEALFYRKYLTNSDVWSYGMVLFEIWSVGKKPFPQFSNSEVLRLINAGYNQPPPPGCPRAIYKLMVDCWHPVYSQRPPFNEISRYLRVSNDTLLGWWEEDETVVSSKAGELGAPLSEAVDLYKDLQEVYLQLEDQ